MSVYSSRILKNMFGTEEMRAIFSDEERVRNYARIEQALAKAECELGIVPKEAYAAIAECAPRLIIDWERLRSDVEAVGYPVQPFLNQMSEQCGSAGEYLHWGSTTRDISDTSMVLQVRSALAVLDSDLRRVRKELLARTRRHRDTLMIARTHGMHALPSTFGFRCAVWLTEVDRQIASLEGLRTSFVEGQFGGAVGSLAALDDRGLEVQRLLMQELGLEPAEISWFASRDRMSDVVFRVASIAATMASIAKTLVVMTRDEVREVREPSPPGRGTSSAMPHKHNTVGAELVLVHAKMAAQLLAGSFESMIQDYERDYQGHFETIAVPQIFLLSHAAVKQMAFILEGLHVDEARMARNLGLTNGLVMAESVMMHLAPRIGRKSAHKAVSRGCELALEKGVPLREVLLSDDMITKHLSAQEIDVALDPRSYLGSTLAIIDAILERRGHAPDQHSAAPAG